jgi:hypothetical protein
MNSIVFHSFYRDPEFTSLKHALLYFDRITVPSNSFVLSFGDRPEQSHYVQLIPDHAYEHLESLQNSGIVCLRTLSSQNPDPIVFYEATVSAINQLPRHGPYSIEDVQSILDIGNLTIDEDDGVEFVKQVVLMMCAFCLKEITQESGTPFVDNSLIHEALGAGLSGLIEAPSIRSRFGEGQVQEMRSILLAQRTLELELPSFRFKSFDDVIAAKVQMRDEIAAFDQRMYELSQRLLVDPWAPGFSDDLDAFVQRYVKPEVDALRARSRSDIKGFIGQAQEKALGYAGLALGLYSIMPDLMELIAAGASVAAVSAALIGLRGKRRQDVATAGMRLLIRV